MASIMQMLRRLGTLVGVLTLISIVSNSCLGQGNSEMRLPDNATELLNYFCAQSGLLDRGVCNTPFAPRADEWILIQARQSEQLRQFLSFTEKQTAVLLDEIRETEEEYSKHGEFRIPSLDQPADFSREAQLFQILKPNQTEKLFVLYLNHEGLMALRRKRLADFAGVSNEMRKKLTDLAEQFVQKANDEIHKKVFSMTNQELQHLPKLNLKARILSSELDYAILALLNEENLRTLAPLIKQCIQNSNVMGRPGIGP